MLETLTLERTAEALLLFADDLLSSTWSTFAEDSLFPYFIHIIFCSFKQEFSFIPS